MNDMCGIDQTEPAGARHVHWHRCDCFGLDLAKAIHRGECAETNGEATSVLFANAGPDSADASGGQRM